MHLPLLALNVQERGKQEKRSEKTVVEQKTVGDKFVTLF